MASWLASARKMVYGLTDSQDFVREATNNEQWGPTSKQHQQIVQYTYHYEECRQVMEYLYKRLNEDGKNWREIYKSLLVLDNVLKNGSEEAVEIALSHIVDVKTLQSFQKIDEDGKDVGINVRERAKIICEMLNDKEFLKQERATAKTQKRDYSGVGNCGGFGNTSSYSDNSYGNSNTLRFNDMSPVVSDSFQQKPDSYHDNEPIDYGKPGSYKDNAPQQTTSSQQPPQSQSPKFQFEQPKQEQPKTENLLDFGTPAPKQQQQKPLETGNNLFDLMGQQKPQQQTVQQQKSTASFWDQPTQQQKSNDLFDFAAPTKQQKPQQQQDFFSTLYTQPTQQQYQQPVQQRQQQNTTDLFSGMTVQPTVQQPQQQQTQNFEFGDFNSAQDPKKNDWRSKISVDSIEDKRKQPAARPQQRTTLGGTFL
ncbi:epsin-3, putative [Entamoeba invadens IP1]|uniref:Epsin-3, putative n=1 Tax=Entamoeba invadens IP1 TaxID=370355 RepID=A0A0A1TVZ0_ENTIV|nr:epsin-3, putative [Entamoeba invadens IP1]ELP83448.1 epsin-3, putative [Entamoeba invadens IP1]|eukprot:XP_004182794.1 epsin-3, putative [Entamoeba invadens IP1]